MFAAKSLHKHSILRCVSAFLNTNPSRLLFADIPTKPLSNDVICPAIWGIDSFPSSYGFNFVPGSCRWNSKVPMRKSSMRSRVERRMQKESGKADREIRRAKSVRLKLMTDEERLIHNLRRAKKKVALLLQKLKKYDLPELPPPRHDPELLTPEQLQAFKKIGFRNKNYVPVGVRGVFGGVVQNMHLHWKFHETVQVCCDNFPKEKIKEMATMLARLTGGIVINIHNVKTIIMFRGRNYRQPKNLIPINTLTKRKALFKARFEQALESQKLNIKKYEQELRRKGINPEDPVAIASIQRVASTFFNAIDKKEGSPYVFHGDEKAKQDSMKVLELSDPGIDSDQEELDKFIAEIEGAADREWAEEEAAEKEELGKIRYLNREEYGGGRFRKPELRGADSDDEEHDPDEVPSDLEGAMSGSDVDESLKAQNSGISGSRSNNEKEKNNLFRRGQSNALRRMDNNLDSDEDESDEAHHGSVLSGATSIRHDRNTKAGKSRAMASYESETDDDTLSELETEMWEEESDDEEDLDSRALKAADDDYQDVGVAGYGGLEEDKNGFSKKGIHKPDNDEDWDSD
ncbi:hypothetical protein Dimus_008908 [Dionaea muscipula]